MAQAAMGDTVQVHYTGRLRDGTVFDSSAGREPLEFTLGQHQVIAGFEHAIAGMQVTEEKTADIPVDQENLQGLLNTVEADYDSIKTKR